MDSIGEVLEFKIPSLVWETFADGHKMLFGILREETLHVQIGDCFERWNKSCYHKRII